VAEWLNPRFSLAEVRSIREGGPTIDFTDFLSRPRTVLAGCYRVGKYYSCLCVTGQWHKSMLTTISWTTEIIKCELCLNEKSSLLEHYHVKNVSKVDRHFKIPNESHN